MKSEIVLKQQKALKENKLDALVAVAPESVIYSCGFVIPSLRIQGLHRRLAMTVVTPDDSKLALILVNMEATTAQRRSQWFSDIRAYREFEQEACDLLVETLRDFGLAGGRIGIELDYLPAKDFQVVREALPSVKFEDARVRQ